MTYTLIPKLWYTITPQTDCDIDTPNGISIHLPAGIQYFHFADSVSIDISGTATITQNPPLFKPASASALGGGYIEGDVHVGHGAAEAVAAVCTLALGDLAEGGTLADSNGQSVELDAPHAYSVGHVDIADATAAAALYFTAGDDEIEIDFESKPTRNATLLFTPLESYGGTETPYKFSATNEYKTCEFEWDAPAGSTVQDLKVAINDEDGTPHWRNGPPLVVASIDDEGKLVLTANILGAQGNGYKVTPSDNTPFVLQEEVEFTNGQDARTAQGVVDILNASADCPAVAVLDEDGQGIALTAREYGVDYELSEDGSLFENPQDMTGGHGDYTVDELLEAIGGEFTDITAEEGAAEGTITLTANAAGAAANAVVFTATGCFGSGTTRQGSTVRGRNAVAQTDFEIVLNGNQPRALTPTTVMKNGGVYTITAEGAALDFSAVTLDAYRAASVWLEYNGPSQLEWPAWSWATEDGLQPNFDFFHRYKLKVENDGVKTRAVVADSYATHPEYQHTVLTKTNMTDASLELYIVPDETTIYAGAFIPAAVDMWGAFSADKFTAFYVQVASRNMNQEPSTAPLLPGEYAGYGSTAPSHRPMITFCTSRPVSVHAVSFRALLDGTKSCVVVQAEVDGEWVLLGGVFVETEWHEYVFITLAAINRTLPFPPWRMKCCPSRRIS